MYILGASGHCAACAGGAEQVIDVLSERVDDLRHGTVAMSARVPLVGILVGPETVPNRLQQPLNAREPGGQVLSSSRVRFGDQVHLRPIGLKDFKVLRRCLAIYHTDESEIKVSAGLG